jgi:hypothetical protein
VESFQSTPRIIIVLVLVLVIISVIVSVLAVVETLERERNTVIMFEGPNSGYIP